jgi:hypothetical protein
VLLPGQEAPVVRPDPRGLLVPLALAVLLAPLALTVLPARSLLCRPSLPRGLPAR